MIEIERALNRDINIIKEVSLSLLNKDNVISIYLYGGYGRDEGSWVLEEINGQKSAKPYNDYDIALIVKDKVSKSELRKLESEIKKKVEVKWIDLCQYTISKLKRLNATIQNYDFKYASKWICGDRTVLDNIPQIDRKSISLKDVETLYITRLWTLVGSFPKQGLKEMSKEDEMFFRNQMAKCILAIVDNILVLNKDYDASYKKRVDIVVNYTNDIELINLAKWALEEKLFPKNEGMGTNEIITLYKNVNTLFFKYFYSTLSVYYKKDICEPKDIDKYIVYNPKDMLRRIVMKVVFNDARAVLNMHLSILQGYLAFYYFDMKEEHVRLIQETMEQKFNFYSNDMDEIRLKVAELRTEL
jgi:predicted nucleotidyltransferase